MCHPGQVERAGDHPRNGLVAGARQVRRVSREGGLRSAAPQDQRDAIVQFAGQWNDGESSRDGQ